MFRDDLTMNNALAGLVGVVAGAITTGGIQIWLASRQRRNDALASARLAWAALSEVVHELRASEVDGTWRTGLAGLEGTFERGLAVWDEQRRALARAVNSYNFRRIEIAFSNVRTIQAELQHGLSEQLDDAGFGKVMDDPDHDATMYAFLEALEITQRAGRSGLDRFTEPRREARHNRGREAWIGRSAVASGAATTRQSGSSQGGRRTKSD